VTEGRTSRRTYAGRTDVGRVRVHNEDMVLRVPRSSFPPEIPVKVGEQLLLRAPDGNEIPAFIVDVDDAEATLDANHPLAGFTLTFEIELLGVG